MISHSFVQCRATDDSGCQEEGGSVFLSICQGIFQYWFIFINALFSILKDDQNSSETFLFSTRIILKA